MVLAALVAGQVLDERDGQALEAGAGAARPALLPIRALRIQIRTARTAARPGLPQAVHVEQYGGRGSGGGGERRTLVGDLQLLRSINSEVGS